jgi:hypothetical protein
MRRSIPRPPGLLRVIRRRQGIAFLLAVLFLSSNVGTAFAQTLAAGNLPSLSGVAGVFRLRVPTGGSAGAPLRPELSLSLATEWQAQTWSSYAPSSYAPSFRYTPALELKFALGGTPALNVGAVDLLQRMRLNANEEGDDTESDDEGGVPNWVWWGLAGATAVTLALVLVNNCHYHFDDIGYGQQASCEEPRPPPS